MIIPPATLRGTSKSCSRGFSELVDHLQPDEVSLQPFLGLQFRQPLGNQSLVVELKWLTELETKKRLEGDFIWLKVVYKF